MMILQQIQIYRWRREIICRIRVFSSKLALCIKWPKYWNFSFSISPSSEYSGLISFRIDWFDLLAVQGTLKSLLQHHSLKASILLCSAFFMAHLSHAYMTKTIACYKNKLEHMRLGWHPAPAWDTHQLLSHVDAPDTGRVVTGSMMGNLDAEGHWRHSNRKFQHHLVFCVWLNTECTSSQHWMLCGGWISSICSSNSVLWSSFSILLFSAPILNHFIFFSCLWIFTLKLWQKAMAPHSSTVA